MAECLNCKRTLINGRCPGCGRAEAKMGYKKQVKEEKQRKLKEFAEPFNPNGEEFWLWCLLAIPSGLFLAWLTVDWWFPLLLG